MRKLALFLLGAIILPSASGVIDNNKDYGFLIYGAPIIGEPITFNIEGVVNSVTDPQNDLEGIFRVGDKLNGFFTFDSLAPDLNEADTNIGQYNILDQQYVFQETSTLFVPPLTVTEIRILSLPFNGIYEYSVELTSPRLELGPVIQPEKFVIELLDTNPITFSDALPIAPPSLIDFESKTFSLIFPERSPGAVVSGEITSLTLSFLVGGQIIPIETTSLILAGAQSNLIWLLPVVIAGAGLVAFKLRNRI